MSIRRSNHAMRSVRTSGKLLTRAVGALLAAGLLCGTVTASVASAEETLQNPEISQGGVSGTVENADSTGTAGTGTGAGNTGDTTGTDGNTNTGNTDNADGADNTTGDSADGTTSDGASNGDTVSNQTPQNSDTTDSEADSTVSSGEESQSDQNFAAQADDKAFDKFLEQSDQPKNGTQVNLFDYWLEGRTDSNYAYDKSNNIGSAQNPLYPWVLSAKNPYGKINNGHVLYFSPGDDLKNTKGDNGNVDSNGYAIKAQTNQGADLVQGLVEDKLSNGYPKLKYDSDKGVTRAESLDYLFNAEQSDESGKRAFMDTDGLLQVDNDGYYYYNSQKNFASFDEDTNSFKLYQDHAVSHSDGTNNGQFFPFNTASDVFEIKDGKLTQKDVISTCPGSNKCGEKLGENNRVNLNHYFGVSMTTRFMQPTGGMVTTPNGDEKPMTYEFSGDDDVWVFIDDQLVGDLGGIHNRAYLSIDFSTGSVIIKTTDVKTGQQTIVSNEKLSHYLGQSNTQNGTLKDNTFHTLKFFYLERGNVDSNMYLKFNLKTVPESDVIKVDQNGKPVEGAKFELWAADQSYQTTGNTALASGETDVNGNLVLADVDGNLVNFDEQYKNSQAEYYVLKETAAPAGYRKMPADMHLKYVPSESDKAGGVIQSETAASDSGSIWYTGSMALSKVVASTPESVRPVDGGAAYTAEQLRNGTLFAVVLRRDKSKAVNDPDAWKGVYGNQVDGWQTVESSGKEGIAEAISKNQEGAGSNVNVFAPNTNGSYEVTVENLPGDIQKYYWMLPENRKGETEYTVAYYYSSASDVSGINADNITRLNSDDFIRQFGASLYVSNIKNQLFVQKVDDAGNPINGVEFKLYKSSDVEGDGTGVATLETNATAYDTLTTADLTKFEGVPHFDGAGMFPTKNKVLENGIYYLQESSELNGYVRNSALTKVMVTDEGVFADAGRSGDNIKVARGVGYMLKTVSSLGASPDVDNTLTWITAKPTILTQVDGNYAEQEATADNSDTCAASVTAAGVIQTSTPCSQDTLRLDYSAEQHVLEYGPRALDEQGNGYSLYLTDTGILSLHTTQDDPTSAVNMYADRTNLKASESGLTKDLRLNALISGTVMVQVTNDRISGSVSWTKVDKDNTETVLGGSKWKLEKSGDNGYTSIDNAHNSICDNGYTGNGSESCTVTVDQADGVGQFTLSGLLPGDYKLTEIAAPKDYVTPDAAKTYATFTVDGAGTIADVALFGDWNTSASSSNTTCTPGLEGGNCRLTNQREYGPELPETGGNGPMALVWGGLLLAGCGLAGLGYARRRW